MATVHRAAFDLLDEIGEDIAIPTVDGTDFILRIAPLQTLLPYLVTHAETFANLMRGCISDLPPNHRWSAVLYADEITPGDLLRPECDRKVAAYYISFLEFGQAGLCNVEAWLPVAIIRAKVVKAQILGRYGCMFRKLLRHLWLGPTSVNAARAA